ncbi:hypothetical protein HC174_11455 [Salinimicrobium sp. CDJ15-81-2]|nr:hypothetical protein [Salinimicrobium nanhaiense]
MRPEQRKDFNEKTGTDKTLGSTNVPPPKKEGKGFTGVLKKVGFKVWLAVMIIGGTLAFIVALFLL